LGTGGTGTFNVSLTNAITKLAQTTANGGAGISFSSVAPGRATIVINPEDEISFSIADAAGRTVMSGKLKIVEQLPQLFRALHSKSPDLGKLRACTRLCRKPERYCSFISLIGFAVLVALYYQQ
jgi:hypothetical protein